MYLKEYKKAFFIRSVEEFFLKMFNKGKISGTVHTCVGQEFSGIFAAKFALEGDYIVSNHRGHGHYLSFTDDYEGLIRELLGHPLGCSKGVGGSQHLYNRNFFSNGIQGGMLPIAAGLAFSHKQSNSNNISFAFLGDGTLGEGILYETLNLSALWELPMVYILEKNGIAQSTSFSQNFSGDIGNRILGFGIKYFKSSIYNLSDLNDTFKSAIEFTRTYSKPVFVEIELGRLNSHSKGDDNRDSEYINYLSEIDPLNLFVKQNLVTVNGWNEEIELIIDNILDKLPEKSNFDFTINSLNNSDLTYHHKQVISISEERFNELIYIELDRILSTNKNSLLIGEDIENDNEYNPKEYGGAFKVTRNLSNKYPNQVKNTPISEQAITGFAIGASLSGNLSIVEIMFGDFTTLVFDQLLQHVSKFTAMYGVDIKIPFILRTPMGGFRGYGPTHSQSLEKHFLGIPGLTVIALNQLVPPSEIFKEILLQKQPVMLIENKALYTKKLYENIIPGYSLSISKSTNSYPIVLLRPVEYIPSLTIISYGGIVDEVLVAVDLLFKEYEILAEIFVISELTNSFVPGLKESLNTTQSLAIIEEGNSFASFSSEVVSNLIEINSVNFRLLRISNNSIIPSSRELELNVLPTSLKIKSTIINFINE